MAAPLFRRGFFYIQFSLLPVPTGYYLLPVASCRLTDLTFFIFFPGKEE
jgi:hypothetical protein